MKAIKKWLMDKEGVFIVITWWIILFVVFTILLGVNISSVSNNLKITKETAPQYIQEFIKSGDLSLPYNENVLSASAQYNQEQENYLLKINTYTLKSEKEYEANINLTGDATASAKLKINLSVIDEYSVIYNHTLKSAEIDLLKVKTEDASSYNKATIQATPSGELHILWNAEDTGVVYTNGMNINVSRDGNKLLINGEATDVSFVKEDEDGDYSLSYKEVEVEQVAKSVPFDLVIEYKIGSKNFTTSSVNFDSLSDAEKGIMNDSVSYFTQLLEESIGISKSAFTLVIVSSIVDVLLLVFGVVGVIYLKKSKED